MQKNYKQIISTYFTEKQEELNKYIVDVLSAVVAEKTVNVPKERLGDFPYMDIPGQESRVANLVAAEFNKIGIKFDIHEMVKDRANIIGYYGEGKKSLLVASHLDIVPPGNEGWICDPYKPFVKDGMLYGRGVLDNKGPLVSSMLSIKALKELNIPIDGKFILGGIASEEHHEHGEEDPGLDYLIKNKFLQPDYAIIPDVGYNMRHIDIAEKGRMCLKVTAIGKQAHGSTPEKGINAIVMMSELIAKIKNLQMKHTKHNYLEHPSLNIGIIQAGSAANIVPAKCEVIIDIRYVPGQNAEHIVAEIKQLTSGISNANFEFEIESATQPHEINPNNLIVETIQSCTKNLLGFTPALLGMGGSTFAKGFNIAGIPAVGFGPGDDDAFHIVNEYVELKQLFDFAHLLCHITIDILGIKNV